MNTTHLIAPFVQSFLQDHLAARRGLSPNTILGYKDGLKLLLLFAIQQRNKPADKLTVEDFDEKLLFAFLEHLETSRMNCTQTRNTRLAALHGLFRYVAEQEPFVMGRCQRICAIPLKRTQHNTIEYLEDEEMRAILGSIDQNSRNGLRDYALVLFLYNSQRTINEYLE